MKININEVDTSTLEVDGVDTRDYPDFVDAYFSYGETKDGRELTEDELDELANDNSDLLSELAYEECI